MLKSRVIAVSSLFIHDPDRSYEPILEANLGHRIPVHLETEWLQLALG